MANCCNNNLNKIFCNAFNKYYNTLYTNGEINKKETNNLLVISYIRKLMFNPRYNDYRNILLKALRCIANSSCLLDSSWLYDRGIVPNIGSSYTVVKYHTGELDPTVPLYVKNITQLDITNWNGKVTGVKMNSTINNPTNGIVDLGTVVTTEADPVFLASAAATITFEDISNWNNPPSDGALIVTLTLDSTYSADKTFAEISTAWNSGLDIVLQYTSSGVTTVYQLQYIDSGSIYFFRVDNFSGPYLDYFALDIDGNTETWSKSTVNLQSRLTFDNKPTVNSSNPVKSSGIYNMCPIIEDIRSQATDVNIIGAAPFATLADGQRIVLHFKYDKTTQQPTLLLTLSDNSTTGAIDIYFGRRGGLDRSSTTAIKAGSYIELVYDNTNTRWVQIGQLDTNTEYNTISQDEINTGTSTNTRVVTPKLVHDNVRITKMGATVDNNGITLAPRTFYNFIDALSSLRINGVTANSNNSSDIFVYAGKFKTTNNPSSSFFDLRGGIVLAPNVSTIEANKIYEFSILDNVLIYMEVGTVSNP